jgi:NhaP-type Na+/H+ or K+/H+ antiporter
MIKQKLLRLVDRRTVIAAFVITLLFILAFRSEKLGMSAIDGMVYVAIGIAAGNSAEHAFRAFASRGKPKKEKESAKE